MENKITEATLAMKEVLEALQHLKWSIDKGEADEKVDFADERSKMIASDDVNHAFECAIALSKIVYDLPNSIQPKQ